MQIINSTMKKLKTFSFLAMLFSQAVFAIEYDITDYGAIRDKISTSSIQKAIDACYQNGGGTVVVPAGTFITGTIFLENFTGSSNPDSPNSKKLRLESSTVRKKN
jgi:hypothetical protein